MTARDLIKGSLRLIGAIATGETPSADESADALACLNRMLGYWSTDSLMCIAIVREEFLLVSGRAANTMGVGGNFDTDRPLEIVKAKIVDNTATPPAEYPLEIVTVEKWADIIQKGQLSTLPSTLYPEGTNPLETLNLFPIPTANSIAIYSRKPLTAVASLSTQIDLPPGWEDAILTNLAVKLSPEFGRAVTPDLAQQAMDSKAAIQRQNIRTHLMTSDATSLGKRTPFNIYKGDF